MKERRREDSLPSLVDPSELDGTWTGLGGRRATDVVLVSISRERIVESGKAFCWSASPWLSLSSSSELGAEAELKLTEHIMKKLFRRKVA